MSDKENPGTIAEIPRMITDEAFQQEWLAKVTDPVVRSFWENEIAKRHVLTGASPAIVVMNVVARPEIGEQSVTRLGIVVLFDACFDGLQAFSIQVQPTKDIIPTDQADTEEDWFNWLI